MKRFYMSRVGDTISIKAFNHELITFSTMGEIKNDIKRLTKMSDEEFIKYCLEHNCRFRIDSLGFKIDKDSEEWYNGAWKQTTLNILKEIKLKDSVIPECDISVELVKSLKGEKKNNDHMDFNKAFREIDSIEEGKESFEEISSTEEKEEKPKKAVKKLIKSKKAKKAKTETTKDNKESLRKLFKNKEITLKEYRERMKALRG